ncbi:hypothetical protein RJ639_016713 [Escallonia herrerae]|uniref:At1g61320/AtMIF1 LRR domain-containing protein n=1 Tax=Escallonia herrerae TaxID=1293975 RepID=A0AA89AKX6_9ASTE|nr:hypothetical protein RJ639_016713 [Escallonia herrerae]
MLVSVLSFLTMRDAAVASLLSHRWRNLWEYFTGILTFDRADEERGGVDENPKLLEGLRSNYVPLVNLTGELIEHFLSHCPVLEQLCVQGSIFLVDLKVTGSLKHLEIYQCTRIHEVVICAPDLVSLVFSNYKAGLHIKYAPKLVDTLIGWTFGATISSVASAASSYLLQLETLTLDFVFSMGDREAYTFFRFPKLQKLRNLTWKVVTDDSVSLLGLTSRIEASPSLQKFTLEISWGDHEVEREVEKAIGCPHPCLQVVQVVGFVGRAIDVELVMYLLEHAGKLERIVLNPALPCTIGTPLEFIEFEGTKAARERALQLKASVPRGAELVVL